MTFSDNKCAPVLDIAIYVAVWTGLCCSSARYYGTQADRSVRSPATARAAQRSATGRCPTGRQNVSSLSTSGLSYIRLVTISLNISPTKTHAHATCRHVLQSLQYTMSPKDTRTLHPPGRRRCPPRRPRVPVAPLVAHSELTILRFVPGPLQRQPKS